ncbi:hypothetical protein OG871_34200 [Kitasatospora sp. NBC_00374]|uniref:hypothetical protein n=1 Tax=Kitasatospora sp. NBC_00374 TaxID=2975964 RepID=UPI0030E24E26
MSEINASTRIRLPREFWKVIASGEDGPPGGGTFLLTRDLGQVEALDLAGFRVFQVDLGALAARMPRWSPPGPVPPGTG